MASGVKLSFFLFFILLSSVCSVADVAYRKQLLFFFNKLELNGAVDLYLKKGKRIREALVYADSEIIDSISLRVREKTLYVDANNTFSLTRRLPFLKVSAERKFPVEIILSVDQLNEIRIHEKSNLTCTELISPNLNLFINSSGRIHLENLSTPMLSVRHEGSGTLVLKGKEIQAIRAHLTGEGEIQAQDLEVRDATIIHQGTGRIQLQPLNWLDARMRGQGELILYSKPERMVIDQTGNGKVKDFLPNMPPYYETNQTKSPSSPTLSKGK